MNSRATLASLAAALALAGCVSSQGLHPQGRLTDPAALRTEHTYAGPLSPAAWPRGDWWNSLGDARLDGLIREGLASSPDLQVADARARQADAAVLAAAAERLPEIGLGADITRSRLSRVDDPSGAGERYSTLRSLSVQGGYTFDLWGGQRDAWEAALGRARAGEVDQQAARLSLATDIARAYNDLGFAYTSQDIAEQDLKRTRDMLDLAQRRVSAGLDSEYQLQQTQSLEAASEATLTATRQQLRSAQIRLAVLLGQGPDRGDDLPRPVLIAPTAVSLPPQLPAELVGRRPDLVAARWRVEAAAKDIDATKTEFYPNLNLNLAAGVKSLLGDAVFAAPSRYFNLGPALSLPIFDGGRRRADLAGADADYDLAVATYNQTLVRALGDVGDTITRLRAFDEQILQQQRARDIARSSYDIAMRRYGEGIGSYLDSLTVEQQLLQAERQLASLQAQRIDSAMLLMQALGGGFQPTPLPPVATAATRTD
ncbi:efflux transporter outer membrane subunit [Pseudomonas mangiferae]|uniref:Efflux transporter outer membrane subunit n=1 Tax=Pseudomonas mangiferae TaxID=2593654 RepID=A0A553H1Q9_9PSED|nr:efflux transporter outer membrane subunit [Pseudomonas mangiferae]TRX75686.1 efflux transporter outer membrane subunit [Pseudomonas mangiferae]